MKSLTTCLVAGLITLGALAGGAQEVGEEGAALYSDGFESGNTLAWSQRVPPLPAPDAFRMIDLDLRDPHVFADVPVFGCVDFTDDPLPLGLGPAFNESLQTAIETDGDADGFLDFSYILGFRPFAEPASGLRIDAGCGACTEPLATTTCDWDREVAIPRTTSYDAIEAGLCLEALPGTTSGYTPAVPTTSGPCMATNLGGAPILILVIGGVPIELQDGQIAGGLIGEPVFRTEGLVRGFLSEAAADAIILPVNGGIVLSSLLPGGTGACSPGDDRDMNDGVSGWWFYLEQISEEVAFIGD